MTEEEFEDIYEEAITQFAKYRHAIKGQQLSIRDNVHYWIASVAYQQGRKSVDNNE